MTRVLIVDDEILVRLSLKTLISWKENGFEIAGEAENGLEALAILENCPCDIVLTDIRMPELDGIELMNIIRERWPDTRIIVLSSYNDFEYVQRALQIGANDYILKLSWVPSELLQKCMRIRAELEVEQANRVIHTQATFRMEQLELDLKEKLLRNLLVKQGTNMETDRLICEIRSISKKQTYRVACASIDNYQQIVDENRFKSEQLLSFTIINILKEIVKKYGEGDLIEIRNERFAILMERLSEDMLVEMHSAALAFAKVSLSFGIVKDAVNLNELHSAFIRAEHALQSRFYNRDAHYFYDTDRTVSEATVKIESLQEDYWNMLMDQKPEQMADAIHSWYEKQKQFQVPPALIRERWLHLLLLFEKKLEQLGKDLYVLPSYNERYPYDIIRNAETLQEITEWFGGWAIQTLEFIRLDSKPRYRQEIIEVMNIIQQEYATALKVSDIARRVGFAETYLSVLFKKETGEKIVDYLMKIRMKKARELLLNPSYKIYEISEMIGYSDATHFSKYFKKIEGVFPLEYRKAALKY
ncbi:response regulator [Paenibacillus chondroitinus]|uniref:Response regulator n=1 Tax=Paenibacillus chondroitinus TaxID=59842 RepID=A0ABU6DBY6_9BACL|nr:MULTISPECIES: response regulator [Paenibacillus]MCY9656813.1 response regulator [Paenibacillus anseongense]MEB4794463.1 response regulator [Paenibacillus chondroitinus]